MGYVIGSKNISFHILLTNQKHGSFDDPNGCHTLWWTWLSQAKQSGCSWVGCQVRSSRRKKWQTDGVIGQCHYGIKYEKGCSFGSIAATTMAMFEFHQLQSQQLVSSTAHPWGLPLEECHLMMPNCWGGKGGSAAVETKMPVWVWTVQTFVVMVSYKYDKETEVEHSKFCCQGFGEQQPLILSSEHCLVILLKVTYPSRKYNTKKTIFLWSTGWMLPVWHFTHRLVWKPHTTILVWTDEPPGITKIEDPMLTLPPQQQWHSLNQQWLQMIWRYIKERWYCKSHKMVPNLFSPNFAYSLIAFPRLSSLSNTLL